MKLPSRLHRFVGLPLLLVFASITAVAGSQRPVGGAGGAVTLRVRNGVAPVPQAVVKVPGYVAETDDRGEARLQLPAGTYGIELSRTGFYPAKIQVRIRAGADTTLVVQLMEMVFQSEVVVVSATRSGTIVQNQPIRVETVPEEEIEENLTTAPGNLTTLLEELAGVRVQETAGALGGVGLSLQGLRGRYTQVLADGLPLYGGQSDPLSLLQVPPLDLAHVEVIKGTASALYGSSALGGVVNLISRRPDGEPEVLLSQTSDAGSDAVGFLPVKLNSRWGYTLLGGAHRQSRKDFDHDGWSEVPGYRRAEVRPRLFWSDDAGQSLMATLGGMVEERTGGTMNGRVTPGGNPDRDALTTRRSDAGLIGRFLIGRERLVTARASYARTWRRRFMDAVRETDVRQFGFSEVSLSGCDRGHTWVLGAGAHLDDYRSRGLPDLSFSDVAPALFFQDEVGLTKPLTVAASGRVDFHSVIGAMFSPRISALLRPGGGWSARFSAGTGYAVPTPLTEKTEAAGLSHLLPLRGVRPERARSISLDAGWSGGRVEINGTAFASEVKHPLMVQEAGAAQPGMLMITNAPTPSRTVGSELLLRYRSGPLQVIANHTYLHATEHDPVDGQRRAAPLTPQHSAELAWIWESEERGRFGLEISYTGRQRLQENPYRSTSPSYVELNALGELKIGHAGVFLNAMNLTNVRQTRFDPLLLSRQTPEGEWTTDVWGPLEGRVFNLGVRWEF